PAIVIAYFLVSVGFLVLRRREPDMERPLRIGGTGKSGAVIGAISSVLTLLLVILYLPITPFSAELDWKAWVMFGAWLLVGVYFMLRHPTGVKAGKKAESELLAKVGALRSNCTAIVPVPVSHADRHRARPEPSPALHRRRDSSAADGGA